MSICFYVFFIFYIYILQTIYCHPLFSAHHLDYIATVFPSLLGENPRFV